MNAGGLNKRIELLKCTQVKQPTGERIETWTSLAGTWAQKLSLSTRDITREQGTQAISEAKFRIRYRSNINTTMRLVFEGRTYAITGIDEIGDQEGLYVLVREVSGA